MAQMVDASIVQSRSVTRAHRISRSTVGIIILLLAIAVAIYLLDANAARHREDVAAEAALVYANHDLSRTQRIVDELVAYRIYNMPRTTLNDSTVLTMHVQANPALPAIMNCRSPQRLQFKARVVAPTFDTQTSLDDVVPLPEGVQRFSWMLTAHQIGLQEAHVRGIVYCLTPAGIVTTRQTVVDEIRGITVAQPFVVSVDNMTSLAIALLGVIGSGGVFEFIRRLLHGKSSANA